MQDLKMIGTRKKIMTYLLDLPTETKRKKKFFILTNCKKTFDGQ